MRWSMALVLVACSEPTPVPEAPAPAPLSAEEQSTRDVKRYVDAQVGALVTACTALCDAAPSAEHWDQGRTEMRSRWREARIAYERVEGAIAILFPETDADIDGRYEHAVGTTPDTTPFDGNGFIGMHAVERILWASDVPSEVGEFERALAYYSPPRAPSAAAEARAFQGELCARLVRDVRAMERELGPVGLDAATAWRGIQGSIEEQAEKVRLGSTGEGESRYAAHTLADMRANLEGGRAVLSAFASRIEALPDGAERLGTITTALDALAHAYDALPGDALPPMPEGFDPDAPSEAHLATPYGRLFVRLSRASDPRATGSLAARLRATGEAMGIPPLGR